MEEKKKKNRFKILRILHWVLGVLNMLHTYYIIISTQSVQSWLAVMDQHHFQLISYEASVPPVVSVAGVIWTVSFVGE